MGSTCTAVVFDISPAKCAANLCLGVGNWVLRLVLELDLWDSSDDVDGCPVFSKFRDCYFLLDFYHFVGSKFSSSMVFGLTIYQF